MFEVKGGTFSGAAGEGGGDVISKGNNENN
jgi:hypothetical protein